VPQPAATAKPKRAEPWWAPRIWQGMTLKAWLRLFFGNGCAVAPSRWHVAASATVCSAANSVLGLATRAIYGRRIRRTPVEHAPLFVIGHWRCGTTLLHELLALDERHTYPTNYQCFMPAHFLLTEWLATRCLWFLLPRQRAMDNVALSWDRPQEDEFALANLGVPSPYLSIAFPNRAPLHGDYYELEMLGPEQRQRWKQAFYWFVQALSLHNPKRLVLKSPTHTFRIPLLLELFPDARFVHIVRDPYVTFASTIHLWKVLYRTQGLQIPRHERLREQVLDTYLRMFHRLEATRHLVPPQRFCEVKYEDLVARPISELRRVYEELDLSDFQRVQPALERYLADSRDYQTNRYELSSEDRAEVARRWAEPIRRYGYDREPAGSLVSG